ncbi:asparagine synthase (glutamine-hydrolyzing) [Pseudoxanthomonas wuyuanensis]|uniref:asparagine synthase (glutamine-hydrolyzing) n=1 Tax=Pseudoxanthomonas wuyuanensis TaxID=1073196 RepID=A0A286D9F9_9GAMM|nr:asparagine synthase (glutamine-hydrolyzing) [Pseudoxanthomonas wuyuanensis]KAF1722003.1 asparagine synthase (glutamine-hydrolyzing) [Pseudoxanthomonas wuyuanensis]SOD55262.1 asparagine synthase (glutamine-hydrolysing) [Pseudoxanthomonas wuyuanensis]
MCGIAGLVVAPGQAAPSAELGRRMNAVIHHRGPDDEGLHSDDRALLGMRRLSIIDVEGGHQPLYGAERQVCLVFNGEIYNFRELRQGLEKDGHVFATHSDTEVILQAYLRDGVEAFAKLDGMFGIAIWDRRTQELILARDRFGEKPLYYAVDAQRLLFGSELKSLLQSADCPRAVDSDALRAYLAYGYVPAPGSIFQGVRKLPPAHYLRYRDGQVSLHRYWRPSLAHKTALSEAEAGERLEELLDRAVASRLVSDVPFGAFLSGGLDSSTVVALMARHLAQPVKTFTIGFKEAAYSELDDARRVASHLGTEHHELVVEPDAVSLLEKLVWHFDEPFADSSAVPTFLVSELAGKHVKMVLTGDGGDELFGGYDRYLRLMKLERLGSLRKPVAGLLTAAGAMLPNPYGERLARVGERLRLPFQERYLSGVAVMRADIAQRLRAQAGGSAHFDLPALHEAGSDLGAGDSALDRAVAIDLQSYLPDDILVKLDRMAMAASLEGRSPFLQPDLAEFALSLPESYRVRGGRGKHLLREVAAKWLPPRAISKPKQGFAIPLAQWLRGPLRDLAADTFASRPFRERGLIDAQAATTLLDEHVSGRVDRSEALWQTLCLELWAQRFLNATAPRER